jgi:hypothetical protein
VRSRHALPAVMLAVLALTGCVTTAVNSGAYVENGKAALDSTISATASAQLALQARLSGDAPRTFTDVVVTESEQSIAPIESSFGGVDPPTPSDDALRDAVLDAVGTAGDALSDARVAIRRDDMTALTEAGADLQAAQTALQSLRESLG